MLWGYISCRASAVGKLSKTDKPGSRVQGLGFRRWQWVNLEMIEGSTDSSLEIDDSVVSWAVA